MPKPSRAAAPAPIEIWDPPPDRWIKVNVEGSFVSETGAAGVGVVVRNHKGDVILTAWRVLFCCESAEDVEGQACAEGLRLVSQWCPHNQRSWNQTPPEWLLLWRKIMRIARS